MHLPLAFSIHHFVSSVGADAGFAAIVGLAILVLLYFAQARETSSLRDQSVSASERVAELERRLAQLGSATVRTVGQPEPAQQPGLAVPAAPAGVAAPALASATRLIPLPSLTAPAPALAPARAMPAAGPVPPVATAARPATVTPPPATVAASTGAAPPVATPAPVPAWAPAATNGTGEHAIAQPATAGAAQPRPVKKIRAGGGYMPPPPTGPGRRGPGARRFVPILVGVVLAGIAVAALLIVTSSGGNSKTPAAGNTTNAPTVPTKTAFKPGSVTVAVLNGTDVSQLAHRVALKLQHVGYKQGSVATASDQTHSATLVGYVGGQRHAAREVAKALGLSSASVAPADQSAQQVACPPPSSCRADVIVTVGTDLSNTP